MIERAIVIGKLEKMIYDLLQITIPDKDINLFSTYINISPVDMTYLLLELEHEFPIIISDQFIDSLPAITINHLADAICIHSK